MSGARCKWCGVFVRANQPSFTWYRTFGPSGYVGGRWTRTGPDFGWTDPQRLCPECALVAFQWPSCHSGLFAEAS